MTSQSVSSLQSADTVRPVQPPTDNPVAAQASSGPQNIANCSTCGGCGSAGAKCGGIGGPALATDPAASGFGGTARPRTVDFTGFVPTNGMSGTGEAPLQVLRGGLPPYGLVSIRASKDGRWDVTLGNGTPRPMTRMELRSLQSSVEAYAKSTPAADQVSTVRGFTSSLKQKVKDAESAAPTADARVTSAAQQKAVMLEEQISKKNNGSSNDKVRLLWDGKQARAEMAVRRVFDATEMAGLVSDVRAIGDETVQVGIIDELERRIDEQRVGMTDDARTVLQSFANELQMGNQQLFNPEEQAQLGLTELRNLVTQAGRDGVTTHAELMDIINGSESVEQLGAEIQPLLSSLDSVAKQQWERMFGAVNAGPLAPTPTNVEGPFYVPNAPIRADGVMVDSNEPGKKLEVSGKVLDKNGKPIANAVVDLWSANANGDYMDMRGPNRPVPNPTFALRGKVLTDAEGNYKFTTVVPGNYRLDPNNPGTVRPKHLHVKVSAPGHEMLTTQLYSKDDMEHNDTDPVGIFLKELLLDDRDVNGTQVGTFDFVLL